MLVPSVASELIAPPKLGLKLGSMTPVVASKANIRLRVMFALEVVCRTVVKVPAAMILLPTWTIAITAPFCTCGVQLTGLADTIEVWTEFTALAGTAPTAVAVATAPTTAAVSARRCLRRTARGARGLGSAMSCSSGLRRRVDGLSTHSDARDDGTRQHPAAKGVLAERVQQRHDCRTVLSVGDCR